MCKLKSMSKRKPQKKKTPSFIEDNIRILEIGARGDGIAEYKDEKLFIPRTIQNETVKARIRPRKSGGYGGELLDIEEKSPHRVQPPCPYYEKCGGCSLQHISDEAYREWKEAKVRDILGRANTTPAEWCETIFIPPQTRRRATFAAFMHKGKVSVGYHQSRTHQIIDIENCLVLTPHLNDIARYLRPYLKDILPENRPVSISLQDVGGQVEMVLTGRFGRGGELDYPARQALADAAQDIGIARIGWRFKEFGEIEPVFQKGNLIKRSEDLFVTLPYNAFLQPSEEGEAALIKCLTSIMETEKPQKIIELFAGNGTFTGPLLKYGSVQAFESDKQAVQRLQAAGMDGLTAETRDLFEEPLSVSELQKSGCVVLDPPRAGAKEQCAELAQSKVPLIVYISCNPATFARDAKVLVEGGYSFKSLQVIDQFVWSSHLELVGIFTR